MHHWITDEVHLRLSVNAEPLPNHAHRGRRLVQQDVDNGGGGETGGVGGGEGDVVLTVVIALVGVVVNQVGEFHQVAVNLTVPDGRTVAIILVIRAGSLKRFYSEIMKRIHTEYRTYQLNHESCV